MSPHSVGRDPKRDRKPNDPPAAWMEPLEAAATWEDIVLPPQQLDLLHRIADQVENRVQVYEKWGFGARMNRGLGVSALFAGPSGTGKSMAAEVIANALRLDLYRIDLTAVVSKYIGETEKNLQRVFDAAEDGGALLFFDEADALFGKRSEVKDSHDRYANIEINYLFQRMEQYSGVAILATNMRTALDSAFVRRLRFIVTFPFPALAERRRIWEKVFPPEAPVETLDYDRLSSLEATGATIRDIALHGAFLAVRDQTPITTDLLMDAGNIELEKWSLVEQGL
jgi:SpoVK/Ycf46/Vps4 family AAA+-type ATPase